MKTLKDFWNEASGIYNFVDKNGASIDDMDYPLETEVLRMRWIDGEQYEVMLNVEIGTYTWDVLCKRADGAACGEQTLKAKDWARHAVDTFATNHGHPDLEETECPEEEVERYCEEFGILFDENGNIVRSRLELAEDFVEAIKMLGNKPDNLENLAYYLSKHFDVWMEKYAHSPGSITGELKRFAEMEV